jgi:hypothetical protein
MQRLRIMLSRSNLSVFAFNAVFCVIFYCISEKVIYILRRTKINRTDMLKETVSAVGAAFVFSPFGMPIVAHGVAGLIIGTAGLHLVNGVINDIKGAGDVLQRERVQPQNQEQEEN